MAAFNDRFMYDADDLSTDVIPIWEESDTDNDLMFAHGPNRIAEEMDSTLIEALDRLPNPAEELLDDVEMGL